MAKRAPRKGTRKTDSRARIAGALHAAWRWGTQRELWGLGVTAFGVVTLISLLSQEQGTLSSAWSLLLRQIFGVGAYPVGALLLASGLALLLWGSIEGRVSPRWSRVIGAEVVFFAGLGLLHVLADESPWVLAYTGRRGGYIGWALAWLLVPPLGYALTVGILSAAVAGGFLLLTDTTPREVIWAPSGCGPRRPFLCGHGSSPARRHARGLLPHLQCRSIPLSRPRALRRRRLPGPRHATLRAGRVSPSSPCHRWISCSPIAPPPETTRTHACALR